MQHDDSQHLGRQVESSSDTPEPAQQPGSLVVPQAAPNENDVIACTAAPPELDQGLAPGFAIPNNDGTSLASEPIAVPHPAESGHLAQSAVQASALSRPSHSAIGTDEGLAGSQSLPTNPPWPVASPDVSVTLPTALSHHPDTEAHSSEHSGPQATITETDQGISGGNFSLTNPGVPAPPLAPPGHHPEAEAQPSEKATPGSRGPNTAVKEGKPRGRRGRVKRAAGSDKQPGPSSGNIDAVGQKLLDAWEHFEEHAGERLQFYE